jgi:hypothetical protein
MTFHPGHHELHGVTVVLEARNGRTYVGRFDSQDEHGVHLLDVGVHQRASEGGEGRGGGGRGEQSREEYLRRTLKFGVRAEHKHLLVPTDDVVAIKRLAHMGETEE